MADQDATIGVEAHFTLDGKAFLVKKVSYGCNRNADERGSPTDAPKVRLIRMMITPTQNDDFALLYDWAFKNDRKLSGQIEFKYDNDSQVLRKMEFEDAYCVGFRESFLPKQSTIRGYQLAHVPDTKGYLPQHRGKDYFLRDSSIALVYELVLLPQKVKIGSVEITS
ncbi:MAG: type VI secretion system tube protein TssD [Dyadobacter sp.]|uniref:type VI secretion system tube protein TssD n=1 Tax=Dyadobacter sp. TaxID=1914288 RepID=UPI00326702AD